MTVNIKLMNKDKKILVPTRSTKDFSILSNINYPITLSVMNDFSEYRKYIKVFFYFFLLRFDKLFQKYQFFPG